MKEKAPIGSPICMYHDNWVAVACAIYAHIHMNCNQISIVPERLHILLIYEIFEDQTSACVLLRIAIHFIRRSSWTFHVISVQLASTRYIEMILNPMLISMGESKKDVDPLLTHWSYVFLALTHRYVCYTIAGMTPLMPECAISFILRSAIGHPYIISRIVSHTYI